MHLEIPQIPFAGCAKDYIGQLSTTSKGNSHSNVHLFPNILLTVPLKTKTSDKVSMAYIKEILPKTSCCKFILQDTGTEFKNE